MENVDDEVAAFVEAACVPLDADHRSGTLDRAEALRAADPGLAGRSLYAAAILGDADAVRRFVAEDRASASAKGGPRNWDALTYLCFSNYLRLDPARGDGLVRSAAALLDAGANPNTGWFEEGHQPAPVFESAIYGAAGVSHHAALTRLLLARGADPNDDETPYHTPETYDNAAMTALLDSGKLNADSLAMLLVRKSDWHDDDGLMLLLQRGADPSRMTRWGMTPLHHAISRDNGLPMIERLLDHGADPARLNTGGVSSFVLAAQRGRGDVLSLFDRRGLPMVLSGVDALLAACARDHAAAIRALTTATPAVVGDLVAGGARPLCRFAANGNTAGVGHLLDLGVPVDAIDEEGDAYFGVAGHSTALHNAAWRAQHETVKALLARGAEVNARDGRGRTPLGLAVLACVDSYWTGRRSPASVKALLDAGATVGGDVRNPSGYAAVDELLR